MQRTDRQPIRVPSWLLVLVAVCMGGCVQTAMFPADKLDGGETQASFSVGEPGALFLPRLNAQFTQGVGGGDVTAVLSATPTTEQLILGGGLAGRSYLNEWLALEGQLQATSFPIASASGRETAGLALLGLRTLSSGTASLYGGGRLGVVSGPSADAVIGDGIPTGDPRIWTAPVVGGTLGYGPIKYGESTRLQIELKANVPVWGDEGEPPIPASGVSIGVFGLLD